MIYLIDANNLAGKLGILKNENFDKLLIKIIRHWPASRKNKIFLVFDSADPMGDKYSEKSDTPAKGGGLMSGAPSKGVVFPKSSF